MLVAKLQSVEQVLWLLLHLGRVRVCKGGLDRPWPLQHLLVTPHVVALQQLQQSIVGLLLVELLWLILLLRWRGLCQQLQH